MSDMSAYTGPEGTGDVNWRRGRPPLSGEAQIIPGTGGPVAPERQGFFRNLGRQLQSPETKMSVARILDQGQKAKYFRHAGFGAALRHTLGLPQTPSHLNDYFRAQYNRGQNGQTGRDPSPVFVEPHPIEDVMSPGEEGHEPGGWHPGYPGGGFPGGDRLQDWHRAAWENLTGQVKPPGEA